MSERLEEIKEAIASELGLTDDWKDGTYLYYLTRTKSAFSVGTVTLDDFEEIDEELLEGIFNAIKPFFIEQAERVQELEKDIEHYKKAIKNYKESFEECEVISQHDRHQNKRYREAREIIEKTYKDSYRNHIDGFEDGYCEGLDTAMSIIDEALEESE